MPRRLPNKPLAYAMLLLGCLLAPGPRAQPATDEALAHHRTLGKAFYENPTTGREAVAEFRKALDLAPASARERVNYGLALLRAGRVEEGIAELQRAQRQDPTIPHTWFNLGIEYKKASRHADAIAQFERMVRLAPDEAKSRFNLGDLYRLTKQPADAIRHLEEAARLDPALASAHFQLSRLYRQAGRLDEAAREERLFEEIRRRQTRAASAEDLDWSMYAEIVDAPDPAAAHDESPPAALRFEENLLSRGAASPRAGLLSVDIDADGGADLVAWSAAGVEIYRNARQRLGSGGLEDEAKVRHVSPGDYNNDGLPDLCVVTDDRATLYVNAGGRFRRERTLSDGRYDTAVWIDYDHDYDVDLMLLGETSMLLRNNGDAGFSDLTRDVPFLPGRATSALVFDLTPDTVGRDIVVGYADRPPALYRDLLGGRFEVKPMEHAPPGARVLAAADVDADGTTDVLVGDDSRLILLRNRLGRFEPVPIPGADGRAAVLLDLENRGLVDLVAANEVFRNGGGARFEPRDGGPGPLVAAAAADFDSDGSVDVAVVRPDASVRLVRNVTRTSNSWIAVRLSGVKNLALAAQAQVEVKAGSRYQKKAYEGVPLHFGLRGVTDIDTIRITWPNGLVQNELRPQPRRVVHYKEAPRLSGSCPMVFTWNGREFQFITDVLGVAPLGASSGDGSYFPTDADEYIQIPGEALAERDGVYEVRITEELKEVAYFDRVRLIAVDHPADVDVFVNDKFKAPPYPDFRLYGVKKRVYPRRATDAHGRDVTAAVVARDRIYPDRFRRDVAGVAELHTLDLDFGSHAAGNRAVLILHGWVDWADGSTFRGAAQESSPGLVFPSVQVRDARGEWTTVVEDMGIPAGKPKTIAVDLTGKFLSSSREVRITTNLCLYWDEVFLGEDSGAPEAVLTAMEAATAALRFRGFSTPSIHPERTQPESFDYSDPLPLWRATWNPTAGLYTRFGDVRELVATVDDRLAIMGSGDELRLTFAGGRLPRLPAGWRRDFLLLVDGWAKDSDANTAFSQSVEPLPFRGMSVYPYRAPEQFPDDAAHREYRERYNTRPALRLLRPLRTRADGAGSR